MPKEIKQNKVMQRHMRARTHAPPPTYAHAHQEKDYIGSQLQRDGVYHEGKAWWQELEVG